MVVSEDALMNSLTIADLAWTTLSCDLVNDTMPLCEADSLSSITMSDSTGINPDDNDGF